MIDKTEAESEISKLVKLMREKLHGLIFCFHGTGRVSVSANETTICTIIAEEKSFLINRKWIKNSADAVISWIREQLGLPTSTAKA